MSISQWGRRSRFWKVPEDSTGRFWLCWRRFQRQFPKGSGVFVQVPEAGSGWYIKQNRSKTMCEQHRTMFDEGREGWAGRSKNSATNLYTKNGIQVVKNGIRMLIESREYGNSQHISETLYKYREKIDKMTTCPMPQGEIVILQRLISMIDKRITHQSLATKNNIVLKHIPAWEIEGPGNLSANFLEPYIFKRLRPRVLVHMYPQVPAGSNAVVIWVSPGSYAKI